MCLKEHVLHASIVRSFDIKCVEISYIWTQQFWNDTSTLQIPPTHLSLMSYLEHFCCALISIFRSQRFRHSYNWRNLSVDTKLLLNQPSRIGRCATLIGYPSMFFVNKLYVGHLMFNFVFVY